MKQSTGNAVPLLIGTAARPGSGQDTFAEQLARRFILPVYSMGDPLREVARARGIPESRENLRRLRQEIGSVEGAGFLAERVLGKMDPFSPAIVTGIRMRAEFEAFRARTKFKLVFVTAEPEIRYRRVLKRASARDPNGPEQFVHDTQKEEELFDFDYLKSAADYLFDCNMNLDSFLADFDRLVAGCPFMPELAAVVLRRGDFRYPASSGSKTILSEERLYRGKLFEVLQRTLAEHDGTRSRRITVETVRRPPGVRMILTDEGGTMLLLLHEYRTEHGGWDYRLPGGKVCDSLEEFENVAPETVINLAIRAAVRESAEETGVEISQPQLLNVSKLGATIEWDLYLFHAVVKGPVRVEREDGEVLYPVWCSAEEAFAMCIDGRIREDRSVAALLRFLRGGFVSGD